MSLRTPSRRFVVNLGLSPTRDDADTLPDSHTKKVTLVDDREGRVIDCLVHGVDIETYKGFCQHFELQAVDWKTSCPTFLVAQAIAAYNARYPQEVANTDFNNFYIELRRFVLLEAFVNRPSPENVGELRRVLNGYFGNTDPGARQLLQALDSCRTPEARQALFSAQSLDPAIPSLGQFIARQLYGLLDVRMQQLSDRQGSRFTRLFVMHPAMKALSHAKAAIEKRLSLYGARHVNTWDPVPEGQLEYLNVVTGVIPLTDGGKTISLLPYLGRQDNIERLHAMLNFFRPEPEKGPKATLKKPRFKSLWSLGVFGAALLEFVTITPIRLALTVTSAAFSVLLRAVTGNETGTDKFDRLLERLHNKFSPVKAVRAAMLKRYEEKHPTVDGTTIVDPIKVSAFAKNPRSFFSDVLTKFSGDILGKGIVRAVGRIFSALSEVKKDPVYLLHPAAKRDGDTRRLQDLLQEQIDKEWTINMSKEEATDAVVKQDAWLTPAPWREADFHSPLDFLDDILVGLSDHVVDRMFRDSPGFATLYFMLSVASLGSLMAPGLVSHIFGAQAEKILAAIPEWLSKHATGASTEAFQKKIVGVFLEWKACFFASEALSNAARRDFSFFEEVFQDPEKILLGLTVLIGIGYSLHFIPKVESRFAVALNFFSEEARHCLHATVPLSGLEYAFLGLKFSLLLRDLFSGAHHSTDDVYKKLLQDLKRSNILTLARDQDLTNALSRLVDRYAVSETSVEKRGIVEKLFVVVRQLRAPEVQAATAGLTSAIRRSSDASAATTSVHLLRQRLEILQGMELSGVRFKTHDEARLFYDALHKDCVDVKRGFFIQEARLLHAVYNKYCYKGSNHAMRILSLVVFPITYAWRGIKYAVASSETYRSEAVRMQVQKSFAKDAAMVMQEVAMIARVAHAFSRAVSYTVRAVLGVAAAGVALAVSPIVGITAGVVVIKNKQRGVRKMVGLLATAYHGVFEVLSKIRLHRTEAPKSFTRAYAKVMRTADVSDHGILSSTVGLFAQLAVDGVVPAMETPVRTSATAGGGSSRAPFADRLSPGGSLPSSSLAAPARRVGGYGSTGVSPGIEERRPAFGAIDPVPYDDSAAGVGEEKKAADGMSPVLGARGGV